MPNSRNGEEERMVRDCPLKEQASREGLSLTPCFLPSPGGLTYAEGSPEVKTVPFLHKPKNPRIIWHQENHSQMKPQETCHFWVHSPNKSALPQGSSFSHEIVPCRQTLRFSA